MKKIMLFLLLCLIGPVVANADCSYQDQLELNSKAANVKLTYELKTERVEYDTGASNNEYFIIKILNITEDTYVEVYNDVSKETKVYHYADSNDGLVNLNWENVDEITNFTVKVYAENSTACAGKLLKTTRTTTPRYNGFYNMAICEDAPDFYLCQKYVTVKDISEDEFVKKVDGYLNGKVTKDGDDIKEEEPKGFRDVLNEYKWYIVGSLAVIGVGAGVLVYLNEKKRRKLDI